MEHVHEAIVVGAGFGGMGATIQLRRLGYDDIVVLEREDDLGGTWHVNRYPGLAVDIPSSTYSYSFEPNPYWSRLYTPGAELKQYAEHVATKHDLRRHMRFSVAVEQATWDEQGQHWVVLTDAGETLRGRFLLTATGFLSQPRLPDIEGIDSFTGTTVHTAAWPDDLDLTGQRVGIIGTGATAVQLIPELAKVAAQLTVYQRTPIYVSPKLDGPIPAWLQRLFASFPLTQRLVRMVGTSVLEVMMVAGVLHFADLRAANRIGERVCLAHLRRQVRDPELRAKLTPDYDFGCKRPTYSNDYYPALQQPHVTVETTPIQAVEERGVRTCDGRRTDLDVLVLATGFDLWDANFPAFPIVGRNGRELGRWWRDNTFTAYEGVTVPGFPNMACLNSPYSYSGLSYFTTIEYQMRHLERLLGAMQERGATTFEVSAEATEDFHARVTERLGTSVFTTGNCAPARSYYFDPQGVPSLLRPTSTLASRWEASRFPLGDYAFA